MTLAVPLDRRSTIADSRGPLSRAVLDALVDGPEDSLVRLAARAVAESTDVSRDEDVQLALFLLYSLHYGSLQDAGVGAADREWDPHLLAARAVLERAFEEQIRRDVDLPELPEASAPAVAELLFALTAPEPGPSLSRFVAKSATLEQVREFLIHRTIYTLREADPHSWAIPRLTGRAKAALVEIQSDEYGGGDPARVHATMFARTVRGVGLDDAYGVYLNAVPAVTLASHNLMSFFGLHARLRGAIVGHLAAFEMTSSIPNRMYGDGFRRLGFGDEVTAYFDEHVEADAVHEQIAGHDLAGALAEDEPALLADIVFGAAACLAYDARVGEHILAAWQDGRSSLRAREAM
ncbi:iron-containing redox enzyme family protein [Microbacterium sp. SLBN-146]|uniref:iron-containing redox enzyme family protein n=1 Tax=Microbacterium sp. SLBN-146 TaxID=2768457 RepID=UPI001154563B|nr:iron-containing redox enzyme family protein [Microbacterium sp. SLBN-146]TQJ30780.1 heme oxygenase-like protein [Microbacterium sp. SLBN-146]